MELLIKNLEGSIGTDQYLCTVKWRNGTIVMDEPENLGGKDRGPDPYTTLLASLAGCTLSTLRMYIDKKGWDIPEISVCLNLAQEKNENLTTFIKREISFPHHVPEDQKKRLLIIAAKCPVSKILENKIEINTSV